MSTLEYEDIEVGFTHRFGRYVVPRDEIVEFARKWDPQPFHLDEEAGRRSIFGGITACAAHNFAIQSKLSNENPRPMALVAGLGLEEMRLVAPVRPDDTLCLETTVLAKRRSASRPDCGIVTNRIRLLNQDDEVVMEQRGKIMVRCRNGRG